jgi:putative photosynthetic complex assembly protein 2
VTTYLLPASLVLFLWWFGTGAVLFLDGLPRRTFRWTLLGATGLLAAALAGLWASAGDASVGGAVTAFACAMMVWAWNEIGFLTGAVTGPRKTASPPGCAGWTRTRHAIAAILYHELALVASGLAILACTAGGENRVGLLTFGVLWVMRLSTKLNIHLGMPNLGEEFLPDHLRYLASWFTRRPMNPLFPVSVTLSTGLLAWLAMAAVDPLASPHEAAGATLLAALVALALVEHWLLVLPVPAIALWRWGLVSRGTDGPVPPGAGRPAPATTPLWRQP